MNEDGMVAVMEGGVMPVKVGGSGGGSCSERCNAGEGAVVLVEDGVVSVEGEVMTDNDLSSTVISRDPTTDWGWPRGGPTSQTTHHTRGTIFQPSFPGDKGTHLYEPFVDLLHNGKKDYGSYVIPKKRAGLPAMPDFEDKIEDSLLIEETFHRDVAWVFCGAVNKEMLLEIQPGLDTDALQPVGSWTNFMKAVTDCTTRRCKLEYLPVIPPHDKVVKCYIDMIQKMLDQLEIDHIFLHADQAIYPKVLIIQWLNQGKYDQIITFLGSFHTKRVNSKILGKRYSCLRLKEWWMHVPM
eukprot:gene6090-11475_t